MFCIASVANSAGLSLVLTFLYNSVIILACYVVESSVNVASASSDLASYYELDFNGV